MKGLYDINYYSINTETEFKNALIASGSLAYSASEPIADNTFNVLNETAHCKKTTSAVTGLMGIVLDGFIEGDIIEMECECLNVSGVKVKLAIDENENMAIPFGLHSNKHQAVSKMQGEWETLALKYVVKNETYNGVHMIGVGIWGADIGEYYLRKIRIRTLTQKKKIIAQTGIPISFRGALVKKTLDAAQSFTTAVIAPITFSTAVYDTSAIFNIANNTRLTVPTGITKVKIKANAQIASNATGIRALVIYKNGSSSYDGRAANVSMPLSTEATTMQVVSPVLNVVAGDYFEVFFKHTSGANLDVNGWYPTWFSMEIVE